MAERIELPADGRDGAELFEQQRMAQCRLVDHVNVVRGRLVVHAPAAVDKGQLAALDEPPRLRLRRVRLRAPPALEEGNLGIDESALGLPGASRERRSA